MNKLTQAEIDKKVEELMTSAPPEELMLKRAEDEKAVRCVRFVIESNIYHKAAFEALIEDFYIELAKSCAQIEDDNAQIAALTKEMLEEVPPINLLYPAKIFEAVASAVCILLSVDTILQVRYNSLMRHIYKDVVIKFKSEDYTDSEVQNERVN